MMVSFCSLQSTKLLSSLTGKKRGYGTVAIWVGECYPCCANIWKYYAAVSLMYYMVWHVNICTKFKRDYYDKSIRMTSITEITSINITCI